MHPRMNLPTGIHSIRPPSTSPPCASAYQMFHAHGGCRRTPWRIYCDLLRLSFNCMVSNLTNEKLGTWQATYEPFSIRLCYVPSIVHLHHVYCFLCCDQWLRLLPTAHSPMPKAGESRGYVSKATVITSRIKPWWMYALRVLGKCALCFFHLGV